MRKDILHMLRRVRELRGKLDRIEACLAQLDPDDQLILDIMLDEDNQKIARICEEFDVSFATGYVYVNAVLDRIPNIFKENMVEIPLEVFPD